MLIVLSVLIAAQPERVLDELKGMPRAEIIEIARESEDWAAAPGKVGADLGSAPPSDAVILLGAEGISGWEHIDGRAAEWVVEDGVLTVAPGTGDIRTRAEFQDVQLHLEFRIPIEDSSLEGQGKGNSGVFLQERYEVQILDSFDNPTYRNGQAAAIYKQSPPLVNASAAPGDWQSYDIVFRAPRFRDDGDLARPGVITVFHNGVLVQDSFELLGETAFLRQPTYRQHGPAPLRLQDHGNKVSFRNIWVRKLSHH